MKCLYRKNVGAIIDRIKRIFCRTTTSLERNKRTEHYAEYTLNDGTVLRNVEAGIYSNTGFMEFRLGEVSEIKMPHNGDSVRLEAGTLIEILAGNRYIHHIKLKDIEEFIMTHSPTGETIFVNQLSFFLGSNSVCSTWAAKNGPLIAEDSSIGRLEGIFVSYTKNGNLEMVIFPPEKNLLLYGLELKNVHAVVFDKPLRVYVDGQIFCNGQDISDKFELQSDGQRIVRFNYAGKALNARDEVIYFRH